ncbi:unnamed protein product [Oppiella nova]|uniref:Cation-transporting P-type ATPase C-terminal domain-containing protein n=1 Tax=Oppiella nova TaxID=334625 RepID=A0A7R9MAR6_9ACAR|nr:unnamed protein product [Oppiella nova]CAG2173846.1 unnamed protein product [Oppiella nova]
MAPVVECWEAFSRCCRLCSRAEFVETDTNPDIMKKQCSGDASETAILRFTESINGSVAEYRRQYPKVAERPFSSSYKYQFSIHKNSAPGADGSNFFLVMKGAPERILQMCGTYMEANGQTQPIDERFVYGFEETYRSLGSKGLRVLALCDYEFTQFPANHRFNLDEEMGFELKNLRFLGLVAMIDPPRPTVPDAVRKCRSAGIKVIMVTGDHPITAQAIARSVNIFSHSHRRSTRISILATDGQIRNNTASIVVPGEDLLEMSDDELRDVLNDYQEIVFARTSPQQKLRIVENCQYLGQIVAVTGDGVNDSPALKKANIGIAMGITGSEVSKQAADMILLDDNFATIVIGVEEGRRIFDNMKKTVSYIMAGSVTTLYPFIVYVIFGFPLAIGTVTVLLICLGTDMMPAIALGYEKAESDIMHLAPRNPKIDKLVTGQLLLRAYLLIGLIETSAGFFGYFLTFLNYGYGPTYLWQSRAHWEDTARNSTNIYGEVHNYEQRMEFQYEAQSAYFIVIVVVQWIDVIICKTRRLSIFQHGFDNHFLTFSLFFETAMSVFFCYTPKVNQVLSLRPVHGMVWLSAVPFFFYIFIFDELRKLFIRRFPFSFFSKELIV